MGGGLAAAAAGFAGHDGVKHAVDVELLHAGVAGWDDHDRLAGQRVGDAQLHGSAATGSSHGFVLFLDAFGAGGGFVIVPALVLLANVPVREAVGSSLLIITMNASSGFVGYLGQVPINWPLVGSFTGVAAVGAIERLVGQVAVQEAGVGGVYAHFNNAIAASNLSADDCAALATSIAACQRLDILSATVSDNDVWSIMAKYSLGHFGLDNVTAMGG